MNREGAANFITGMLAGWIDFSYMGKGGKKKPKKAEMEILDRFGQNVMLAWDIAVDELRKVAK